MAIEEMVEELCWDEEEQGESDDGDEDSDILEPPAHDGEHKGHSKAHVGDVDAAEAARGAAVTAGTGRHTAAAREEQQEGFQAKEGAGGKVEDAEGLRVLSRKDKRAAKRRATGGAGAGGAGPRARGGDEDELLRMPCASTLPGLALSPATDE